MKSFKLLAVSALISFFVISYFSGISYARHYYCPLGYSFNPKLELCVGRGSLKGYDALPQTKINKFEGKHHIYICPDKYTYDKKLQLCTGEGSLKGSTAQPTVEILHSSKKTLKLTKKNAILFLWIPVSLIKEGVKVLESWGFEYSTKMTWLKTAKNGHIKIGLGSNVRNTSEDILIGKKGDFPAPKIKFPSTFFALQTDHSRKPARSYEIIEQMYPEADRIELFARYVYPGWTGVGTLEAKTYTNFHQKNIQKQKIEVVA